MKTTREYFPGEEPMGTWICSACSSQNSTYDGECQFCECEGEFCKRDNCDGHHCSSRTPDPDCLICDGEPSVRASRRTSEGQQS